MSVCALIIYQYQVQVQLEKKGNSLGQGCNKYPPKHRQSIKIVQRLHISVLMCVYCGFIFCVCVCRICHCEGDDECPLIMPCRCTGSLSFVHQSCLNQWIKSSDTRCCELCKFDFVMETKLKPLRKVGTRS